MITVRNRGRLPHWESLSPTYFVTFRLADSLPIDVLSSIRFERNDIVATANALNRDLSPCERTRLAKLATGKVESYLDAGAGRCSLRDPRVARLVAESLYCFEGSRYQIFAWCVMPNHVHVLFRALGAHHLAGIIHSWKSYSGRKASRILGFTGTFWQREYYDHLVRNEADFHHALDYVLRNPAKARLHNWPWVGTAPPKTRG